MDLREIERQYDRAAAVYEQHDALEREVGLRLAERAAFVRNTPGRILDLGCGSGQSALLLKQQFPGSSVLGLDLSSRMLHQFSGKGDSAVQADLTRLPLAVRSIDLVFCNMALQWAGDFVQALNEIRRVLRPEGMLLFSLPGPDSLMELRQSAAQGLDESMPIYLPDLRDVGDCLQSAGFRDPVMDSERLTLNYPSVSQMQTELAVTGGAGFSRLMQDSGTAAGFDLTFEIVYGAAFGPSDGQPIRTGEGEVATFSVESLRKL